MERRVDPVGALGRVEARYVLPAMLERGSGKIIAMGSQIGQIGCEDGRSVASIRLR